MVRSTALLVPIGLLLFSCKTVSVDKRSHRTPNPTIAKVIPADKSTDSTTTANPSVPPTDMPAATRLGGKLWMMPQNSDDFTKLPSNTISSVWNEGNTIYTLHPGVGLAISNDFGLNWKTRTPANGLGNTVLNDIFAQGSSLFIATGNGLAISQDKGETWAMALGGEAYTRIVGTADKVYAVGTSLRISTDKGKTWTQSSLPDGGCVNRLVARGTKLYATQSCSAGSVWISVDDGKNWDLAVGTSLPKRVNDILFWKSLMFASTNSGLFVSDNSGMTWKLSASSVFGGSPVSFLDGSDARIYATVPPTTTAAASTTGFAYGSDDDGTTWFELSKTPDRVRAFGSNVFAFGVSGGGLYTSHNDKISGNTLTSPLTLAESLTRSIRVQDSIIYTVGTAGISSSANGGILWNSVSTDPLFKGETGGLSITPTTWYVPASLGLYSSTDMGKTWTLKTDFGIREQFQNTPKKFALRGIAIEGSVVLLATDQGLLVSNNLGETWEQKTANPAKFIKKVGTKLFLSNESSFGDFSFSVDGGQSWKAITDASIRAAVTDVVEADTRLYASVTNGLGFSDDGGSKWTFSTDPKWAQVKFTTSLDAQGKVVLVGTDSGVFISEDKGATFVTYPIGKVTGIAFRANTAFITTAQALYVFNPAAASLR